MITKANLRRRLEHFNRMTGLSAELDAYKPGSRKLYSIRVEHGQISPFVTGSEMYDLMKMFEAGFEYGKNKTLLYF